jgi:acetylornithine deacetylase/succinyl-diaminopimelate desuccinylase-like protein
MHCFPAQAIAQGRELCSPELLFSLDVFMPPLRNALLSFVAASSALLFAGAATAGPAGDPTESGFRALYKELVETNTTLSVGSCTLAAERMAARLTAAGYPAQDVHLFSTPDHPREGGLVAVLHGRDPSAKAILLLAHIDVVEAKRADWTRDPFVLVEENGYFYGRGVSDDKAMAASFTDSMVRYRREGLHPLRDIKLALTCGEETGGAFNGADWLVTQHKDWIDADFALNEGAGGLLDSHDKPVYLGIQAGEKVYQDFRLETTNPGGHSSRPVPDNAIYHLAAALTRLSAFDFPAQLSDTTRAYFSRTGTLIGGESGAAMIALAKDPTDKVAEAVVSRDPSWHSMLRTTCVATLLDGGHATNALPQRAGANVNCRIFPGVSVDTVRAALTAVIADPKVTVTPAGELSPTPLPPPLAAKVLGPAEQVAHDMWPGVPMIPTMSTGATDGRYLNAKGIPTYGLSGMFAEPSRSGVHGLNERIAVKSLLDGRTYLYRVVKLYADAR